MLQTPRAGVNVPSFSCCGQEMRRVTLVDTIPPIGLDAEREGSQR